MKFLLRAVFCTLNCILFLKVGEEQLLTTHVQLVSPFYSMRVCQGHYDASLLKAWEDWDGKHGSENDHPKEFPEKQVPCKAQFTPFLLIANSCLPLFIYILFFEWILCLGRLIFFLQSGDNYFDHFKCH